MRVAVVGSAVATLCVRHRRGVAGGVTTELVFDAAVSSRVPRGWGARDRLTRYCVVWRLYAGMARVFGDGAGWSLGRGVSVERVVGWLLGALDEQRAHVLHRTDPHAGGF